MPGDAVRGGKGVLGFSRARVGTSQKAVIPSDNTESDYDVMAKGGEEND